MLIAFGLSLLLTPAARVVGVATHFVDHPADRVLKIHRTRVSVLGGVAVVGAMLGAAGILGRLPSLPVLAGIGLALATGLMDDHRPLPAGRRLLLLAAAGGVIATDMPLQPLAWLGGAGTVLLVLLCANGVNLVDGQDGLAGGLSALAGLGFAALGSELQIPAAVHLGLALAGALIGFLLWNRPPARIFLGNGGAYTVGAVLAVMALEISARDGWRGLLASGMTVGVFAFELLLTVARRLISRESLAAGDRLHSYDVLGARIGRDQATLSLWALGAVAAVAASLLGSLSLAGAAVVAAIVGLAVVTGGLALWFRMARAIR